MTTKEISLRALYRHLGELFYSIAASDKKVRVEEKDKLREIVRQEWTTLEESEDEFGSDSAYQIEIVFDWLLDQEIDAKVSMDNFKKFKSSHENLFTQKVNNLIWKTANAIAAAYGGKNKEELIFLKELSLVLKE